MKNFKERIISEEERENIIQQIIEDMWDDELANPVISIGNASVESEKEIFFNSQYKQWETAISKNGIVFDFEGYDISVYTLMYCYLESDAPAKDKFTVDYLHFCRVKTDFVQIENDETFFDLKAIGVGNKYFDSLERKAGRPKRPADKSVILTHKVLNYLDENEGVSIVDACKNFNIPRVSFYRAYKWLKSRSFIYQNHELN